MTGTGSGVMWKSHFVKALQDKGIKIISLEEKENLKSDVENKSESILANRKKTKFQEILATIVYLSVYYLTNFLFVIGLAVGIALLFFPAWLPENFKQIYSEYFVGVVWLLSILAMFFVTNRLYKTAKYFQREHRKYLWRRLDSIHSYSKATDEIVNITRTEYRKLFGSCFGFGIEFFQEKLEKNSFLCVEVPAPNSSLPEDNEIFTLDFAHTVSEHELVGDYERRQVC